MKNTKTTIIIVALFFALFAFVYFYESKKEGRIEKEEREEQQLEETITDFKVDDVRSIKIDVAEDEFGLTKESDEKWILAQDESFDVNPLQVTSLIEALSNLKSKTKFEAENVSEYELEDPQVEVLLEFNDGKNMEFDFGVESIDSRNIYARIDNSNTVFLVPYSTVDKFYVDKESFSREAKEPTAEEEVEKLEKKQEYQ